MTFLKILRYELKKIFEQKSIWVIGAILLCVSLFGVYKDFYVPDYDADGKPTYSYAIRQMQATYAGELSDENIQRFMSDLSQAEVNYNTDSETFNPEKYYIGTAYGDYNMMLELKTEMERIYYYNDYVVKIRNEARKDALGFESKNDYLYKYNAKITNVYSDRKVTGFYFTKGFSEYFGYKFSSFIVMVMLLLGLTTRFSCECETGMNNILLTSRYGRDKTNLAKIVSGFIYALFLSVLFSVIDLCVFKWMFGFDLTHQFLYALPEFQDTTLNIKVWQAVVLMFLLKTLGFLILSGIIMLWSAICSRTMTAYIGSAISTVVLMLVSIIIPKGVGEYLNLLNPLKLINCQPWFEKYSVIRLFGNPVFTVYVVVGVGAVVLCTVVTATLLLAKKFKSRRSV